MSRYARKPTKAINNKLYYRSVIIPTPPITGNDIVVVTQHGDRLDNLAFQMYGDATKWWIIARANNLWSINLEAGWTIRIPGLGG